MIKWKIKPEHMINKAEFYFSKDGFVIKASYTLDTQPIGTSVGLDFWDLEIYYYTNSMKSVIYKDKFHVSHNKDEKVYEANAKKTATKLSKKFMGKYAHRANTFFTSIAS